MISTLATGHTEPSPSGAARWWRCPGSCREIRRLPPERFTTSPQAEEGTLAGKLAEDWLTMKHIPSGDPEMLDYLALYVDHVASIEASDPSSILLVEHPVSCCSFAPGLRGRADALVWLPKSRHLHVVDLKYGRGVDVQAKEPNGTPNLQLAIYGLGACCSVDWLQHNGSRHPICPVEVHLTIVQVRRDEPIRTHVMTGVDMTDFGADLQAAIARTEDQNAPLVPGEKQCRFCPVAPTCPALNAQALLVAKEEFAPMTPEQVGKALDMVPVVRAWANAVEDYAHSCARQGNRVPGYKLVETWSNRQWIDDEKTMNTLLEVDGDADLWELSAKLKSPAKLEKVFGKDLIAKLCRKVQTGETLVDESDKRPETIKIDAKDEFNV